MGKGYYRQLTDILKAEAGAYYTGNGKGSHEHWRTANGEPLIISKNIPSPHTANSILKKAGLKKRF